MKAVPTKKKKEITVTVPVGSLEPEEIQALLNFARYKELNSQIRKIDQKVIDKLASDVNRKWWAKNRDTLVKNC